MTMSPNQIRKFVRRVLHEQAKGVSYVTAFSKVAKRMGVGTEDGLFLAGQVRNACRQRRKMSRAEARGFANLLPKLKRAKPWPVRRKARGHIQVYEGKGIYFNDIMNSMLKFSKSMDEFGAKARLSLPRGA